jgi:hypothetical protein
MTTSNPATATQLSVDRTRRRNAWISVAAIGIAVGGLALAAPDAHADVKTMTISPGPSFATSAQHGSGCTYKITLDVNIGDLVIFSDEAPAAFNPLSPVLADATSRDILWTPLAPGRHRIHARSLGQFPGKVESKDVAVGHDFGSSCWALPF